MTNAQPPAGSRRPPGLASTLLPPGGGLAPPGNSTGKIGNIPGGSASTEPSLEDIGASLTRAGEAGRLLAARAYDTASLHVPEIQRRTAVATAVAGDQARAALQRAAAATRFARATWDASADQPKRRRQYVFGAGVGAVIVLTLIWFVAQSVTTSQARTRVPAAIAQAGLAGSVTYRSISASPFGNVTLYGVGLRIADALISADSVTLDRYATAGNVAFTIHRATVPLRVLQNLLPPPLTSTLAGVGLVKPSVDVSVSWTADEGTGSLSASAIVDCEEAGSFQADVVLEGADPSKLAGISALINAERGAAPSVFEAQNTYSVQAAISTVTNISLRSASFTLEDGALMSRAREITSTPTPSSPPNRFQERLIQGYISSIAGLVPPDRTDAANQTISRWFDEGGRISLKLQPAAPVILFRPGDFGSRIEPTWQDPSVLVQLNADVTN